MKKYRILFIEEGRYVRYLQTTFLESRDRKAMENYFTGISTYGVNPEGGGVIRIDEHPEMFEIVEVDV